MKRVRALLRALMLVACIAAVFVCGNAYEKNSVDASIASYSADVAQCLADIEAFNNNPLHGRGNLHVAVTGPNEVTITGDVQDVRITLELISDLKMIWKATYIDGYNSSCFMRIGSNVEFSEGTQIRTLSTESYALTAYDSITISGGTIESSISGADELRITGGTVIGRIRYHDSILVPLSHRAQMTANSISISGGNIQSDILANRVKISGGATKGFIKAADIIISGGTIESNIICDAELKITGGTITGNINTYSLQFTAGTIYHTSKEDDTLWNIARYYLGDGNRWTEIQAANDGIDPYRLRAGMELIITQQ